MLAGRGLDQRGEGWTAAIQVKSPKGSKMTNAKLFKEAARGLLMMSLLLVSCGGDPIAPPPRPHPFHAYVINETSSDVSIISTASITTPSHGMGHRIDVGFEPRGIAITPDGLFAYVTDLSRHFSGNLSVIDTSTGRVVAAIPLPLVSSAIAIAPGGDLAYAAHVGSLSVIDILTNRVIETINLGRGTVPEGITIAPGGALAYVADLGDHPDYAGRVLAIDLRTKSVVAIVAVGKRATGVALSPDGALAYAVSEGNPPDYAGTVSVIDTRINAVIATIVVGTDPSGVVVSGDGASVYVTNSGSDTVSVIDTSSNSVIAAVSVGKYPSGVAITPDSAFVCVTNIYSDPPSFGEGNVKVIDTSTKSVVATIPVGWSPRAIAFSPR